MIIGSAWTNEARNEGEKLSISIKLDEVILEAFPALKTSNLKLKYVSKEERKSEKSPAWVLHLTKKGIEKENDNNQSSIGGDSIPF